MNFRFVTTMVVLPLVFAAWMGTTEAAPFLTDRTQTVSYGQSSSSSSRKIRYCHRRSSSSSSRSYSSRSYGSSSRSSEPFVHGRCKSPGLVSDLFAQNQMTCGFPGWTFPGLIWGDCPLTACILKGPAPSGFGGYNDF